MNTEETQLDTTPTQPPIEIPDYKRQAILKHIDTYIERRRNSDRWINVLDELEKLEDVLYFNNPDLTMHRIEVDPPNSITSKEVLQVLKEEIIFLKVQQ